MMESVVLKLFILSMMAVVSATPMRNEENYDYNDGTEQSGEENNDEVANYPRPIYYPGAGNYPRPPTNSRPAYNPAVGNYPRPAYNPGAGNYPRPAYNHGPANYPRPYDSEGGSNDDNSQIDGFERGVDEHDNDEGSNTFDDDDEGSSRRYPSNRPSGSDYRSLKRKSDVIIRTSNSRTRLRSRDYETGSEEVSNFGNGNNNRNVFHITKKTIYV